MLIKITNIDNYVEYQRSIEHCGPYDDETIEYRGHTITPVEGYGEEWYDVDGIEFKSVGEAKAYIDEILK